MGYQQCHGKGHGHCEDQQLGIPRQPRLGPLCKDDYPYRDLQGAWYDEHQGACGRQHLPRRHEGTYNRNQGRTQSPQLGHTLHAASKGSTLRLSCAGAGPQEPYTTERIFKSHHSCRSRLLHSRTLSATTTRGCSRPHNGATCRHHGCKVWRIYQRMG